jgi:hypothetical protein
VCDKVIEGGRQVIGVPVLALLLPVTEYFCSSMMCQSVSNYIKASKQTSIKEHIFASVLEMSTNQNTGIHGPPLLQ